MDLINLFNSSDDKVIQQNQDYNDEADEINLHVAETIESVIRNGKECDEYDPNLDNTNGKRPVSIKILIIRVKNDTLIALVTVRENRSILRTVLCGQLGGQNFAPVRQKRINLMKNYENARTIITILKKLNTKLFFLICNTLFLKQIGVMLITIF
ncbi:hypothetical protein BpHYR1_002452 [Brachionus plicatilis]|uniref:Uncharacterized protein n=1 Tax=Brachionus plicatilis TaxID=10195 RepID=A0A3M7SB13_BRAPC|nr:hypothetical protein BpHYR1_002452 [Brachionus plicatilis]